MREVTLRMSDADAATFVEDAAEYPGSPLLTPVQEHDVDFEIVVYVPVARRRHPHPHVARDPLTGAPRSSHDRT